MIFILIKKRTIKTSDSLRKLEVRLCWTKIAFFNGEAKLYNDLFV